MESRKGNAVGWILVIILVVGLGWWFVAGRSAEDNGTATTTPVTTNDDVSLEDDMIDEIIIIYGASGFEPASVTINKGQTVRWVNQSSGDMWVASAMHPTHNVYPGSNITKCGDGSNIFDQCENGSMFEFTFDESGEWGYHNHSRAAHSGKVIVREE